jgi:hypothetical protein
VQFIVRILFSGMMAFIPNNDGTQVDVVLLNVGHGHQLSDGTALPHHKPLILTRAGSCTGTCPTTDAAIASYAFGDKPTAAAQDALETALGGGGAWDISGSQITIADDENLPALSFTDDVRDGIIPATSGERADYSWLAKLSEICSNCDGIDSSVLDTEPPSSLVAARFRLRTGNLYTYSIARIGSDVTPVKFKRLDGSGSESSYSQAIATTMGVDIEMTGDDIELVETKFDNTTGRTMTLAPDENGRIEIAVLNLPPLVPSTASATPGVGKHFERYYDLTATPPSAAARLVPQPGAAAGAPSYSQVTWQSVHPTTELWSELFNALRLNVGRSAYDVTLCPPVRP